MGCRNFESPNEGSPDDRSPDDRSPDDRSPLGHVLWNCSQQVGHGVCISSHRISSSLTHVHNASRGKPSLRGKMQVSGALSHFNVISSHSHSLTSVVPPEHASPAGADTGSQLWVHAGAVAAIKEAVGHVALGVAHAVGQGGQRAARRTALCSGWSKQQGEAQCGFKCHSTRVKGFLLLHDCTSQAPDPVRS